jgi:hypothetical protein
MRVTRFPLAALALSAISCGGEAAQCITPPCALPAAIMLTVTSSNPSVGITGAFIQVGGYSGGNQCSGSPVATCLVLGEIATYEVDIGATGFQTVHRSIVVTGTIPTCGCESIDTQHVSVVLTPVT